MIDYPIAVNVTHDEVLLQGQTDRTFDSLKIEIWEMNFLREQYFAPIGTIDLIMNATQAVARRGHPGFLFDMFRQSFLDKVNFKSSDEFGRHVHFLHWSVMRKLGLNDDELREWSRENR